MGQKISRWKWCHLVKSLSPICVLSFPREVGAGGELDGAGCTPKGSQTRGGHLTEGQPHPGKYGAQTSQEQQTGPQPPCP